MAMMAAARIADRMVFDVGVVLVGGSMLWR